MTIDELKTKHPIILDIVEVSDGGTDYQTQVTFILNSSISFLGQVKDTWEEIDAYCTRAETIIKSL